MVVSLCAFVQSQSSNACPKEKGTDKQAPHEAGLVCHVVVVLFRFSFPLCETQFGLAEGHQGTV